MNKSDSVDIALSLQAGGYEEAASDREADVVVLNTCSVREHAEERIYGRLGHYRSLNARKGGNLLIVLAGCMAQEQGVRIMERYPEIKVVAGTYHCLSIPDALREFSESTRPVVMIDREHYEFSTFKGERARGHSAWVNIIMGCSNFCSYCIVPHLRGPERSKPSGEVVEEIRRLAERGVTEVTLLGQNVNAYGKESDDIGFVDLLEAINGIDGIRWIRFLTSHPKDFTEETVRRLAGLEKVCNHVHLPMQSGSDRILKLMNRRYNMRHYLGIIEAVRRHMHDAAITSDIIVGFPTEEEEDFQRTLHAVREVEYDDAFTYRYSARPFTQAIGLDGSACADTAGRRLEELIVLQRGISRRKNRAEIGKSVVALVERTSRKSDAEMLCRTGKGKMVVVGTRAAPGTYLQVKLNDISGNTLRGAETGSA
jgi:tRNA-2-methylthio-N6-dimethylallyladenosine synthase